MVGRSGLLLALVAAMLLACSGVVLAQQSSGEERTKPGTPSAQSAQSRAIPGRYIVVLEDKTREPAQATGQARQSPARVAAEMARQNSLEVTHTYEAGLRGFAAKIPERQLDEVRSDPRVEFVVQDREVHAFAQTTPTGIDRADADVSSTAAGNGSGVVNADIAVLDTGIYKHSDLNVVGGYNCTSKKRKAWSDGNGHGTHVAGTAAAKDDTNGVVGTAPGARLWSMKVLSNTGQGRWSWAICGINRLTSVNTDANTANNIEVANMSLGGSLTENGNADDGNCGRSARSGAQGTADAVHRAICKSVAAGVTYVTSAGNDGLNTSNYVPASFDEVLTVSSLADYNGLPNGGAPNTCFQDDATDDDIAFSSNWGADVDLTAPGVCTMSTWKGGLYKTISGTSMASPHVAGAAALYKSNNASKSPSEVRTFLTAAANTEAEGAGHIDSIGLSPEPALQMDNY